MHLIIFTNPFQNSHRRGTFFVRQPGSQNSENLGMEKFRHKRKMLLAALILVYFYENLAQDIKMSNLQLLFY